MSLKLVGAIGYPIEHSLSPTMHNAAFAALGMTDWRYDKIAIPPDILGQSLRELRDHGMIGVNVTVPHKQTVMRYVFVDTLAQRVGAVNTIDFRTKKGTNTDVAGFMDDLAAHRVDATGQKVIVLGAGGAARAIVYGLSQAGAQIGIVNRTPERAKELLDSMMAAGDVLTLDQASEWGAALIVNCTSLGMYPNTDGCAWSDDVPFPRGVTVYDTVYRPARTRLMAKAEAHGGQAIGGLGMLVRQGAAAFQIFTGVEPPIEVMFEAVRAALAQG